MKKIGLKIEDVLNSRKRVNAQLIEVMELEKDFIKDCISKKISLKSICDTINKSYENEFTIIESSKKKPILLTRHIQNQFNVKVNKRKKKVNS